MSPAQRPAKNPYCRRSKLSVEQFEKIAYFYFLEITGGWSRHACAEMLLAGDEGAKLSRQSISLYFDAIGDFLWEHVVVASDPRYADKARLNGLLAFIYKKADAVDDPYDLVATFLKTIPVEIKHDQSRRQKDETDTQRLMRSHLFDLLRRRSEVTRGFADDQFYREVARAVFICAAVEAHGVKLTNDKDFFTYPRIKEIAWIAWTILLDTLERHPLDRVE
jgi:hypothetical protein